MRICLIYLGWRGLGGYSLEMATHLAMTADIFAMISTRLENLEAWQKSGLRLLIVPTYRGAIQAALSWLNDFRFRSLAARIRACQPDVLLFPTFYTWNPFLQRHLAEIPTVVAVHDPLPHPGFAGFVFNTLENLSIRRATRCYVLSETFRADLQRRGVASQRIDHVPHADLSYYQRYATQGHLASQPEEGPMLFFGRITAYKGLEVLLQAYRQISQRRQARLLIVGDGDMQPYHDLLNGLPNVEVVNRWIAEQEVHTFFKRARMVILPYTSASQSGVIAIAASFGLPVVATRTGGIPEQIHDGESGLLVAPSSVEELTQAIERLLEDPSLARTLGENLERDYRANRNWDKIAGMVYEICEKAIREKTEIRITQISE